MMMEDIKEIEEHVDSIIRKSKPMRRSKKILGLSVPVFAILVSSMVVSGTLIGALWTRYNLNIQGSLTVNGAGPGTTVVLYDGTPLTAQTTTINTMDYSVLNPGDNYTVTHVIKSLDEQHDCQILFNLSNMPLNYVDPQNLWYGFTFEVRAHGTTTPITQINVSAGGTVQFDYYYKVNNLFANPLVGFPFDLRITIVVITNHPPVISPIPNQTAPGVPSGSPFTNISLDNYVTDAEDPASAIVWSANVWPAPIHLTVSIANRVATITPTPSLWKGTEHVTFIATDTGGLNASYNVTFTITNTPPVANNDSLTLHISQSPPGQQINFTIYPLGNDTDANGDGPLLVVETVNALNGGNAWVMMGQNQFVQGWVPRTLGTYNFTVGIFDGFDGRATSTLTVHVLS